MKWTLSQKAEIKSRVDKWSKLLGLHPMTVYYEFQSKDSNNDILRVKPHYPYSSCKIFVFPLYLKQENRDRVIVHELMHCILESIADNRLLAATIFDEHLEHATDRLAHIITYNFTPKI